VSVTIRDRLMDVNAVRGTPMTMLSLCFVRDPRKCGRFRDQVTRQFKFGGAIGRKTHLADRAPGGAAG
jgi:hypothetical protein